ncbi:MAG TPA: ImmA/IrrE family metallo-endopeptidase [Rhodanobacter sp.]|nr:ImmA/IrrE family metallo-endopeptidase [Rhodanobacter sp.]
MNDPFKNRVIERRHLLQNPYAFIEYLEEPNAMVALSETDGSRIAASRKVLEDPYAYLDGEGGFSVVRMDGATSAQRQNEPGSTSPHSTRADGNVRRYTNREIEAAATDLQRRLWRGLDGPRPTNPLDVLDIRKALHLVGYELTFESGLGYHPGSHIEVAGLIDRDAKVVKASLQFLEPYRAFTLAHELGHAVLHPDGGGIHRDRPLDGVTRSRDAGELEADKFASYFLMPGKLLREHFSQRFATKCFALTDDTAFALSRTTSDVVREKYPARRHLARALAAAETYNARPFQSLATQFRVSVGAMAIRLEELGLVEG